MSEQQIPWYNNGKVVIEPPDKAVGFIYKIRRYNTPEMAVLGRISGVWWNKIYIGKKALTTNRKGRVTKKEIRETGTRKRVKRVIKNSGWLTYNSSNPELASELQQTPELFLKEIIRWCYTKKEMSYWETYHQMIENVLTVDSWNGNICSHWYRRDLTNESGRTE